MSWGGGREISMRPGAAHACKTVQVQNMLFAGPCACASGVTLQDGAGDGWRLAYLAFGCKNRLSRPLNEGARSCCSV